MKNEFGICGRPHCPHILNICRTTVVRRYCTNRQDRPSSVCVKENPLYAYTVWQSTYSATQDYYSTHHILSSSMIIIQQQQQKDNLPPPQVAGGGVCGFLFISRIIKKLISRWDSERGLFYDDIVHVVQNTKLENLLKLKPGLVASYNTWKRNGPILTVDKQWSK